MDPDRIVDARKLDFPFQVGEELTYEATYLGLSAGNAVMKLLPGESAAGMVIRLAAATSGAAGLAFPMREALVVQADTDTLRPQSADNQGSQGDDQRKASLYFDDHTRSVVGRFIKNGEATVRLLHAAEAWDPASLLLLIRSIDVTPPFRQDFELILGSRLVRVVVDALERQDVKTPAGEFENAHHLRGRVFALDDEGRTEGDPVHRIEVWIAADGNRPVVKLTKPARWGEITFELTRMGAARP